MNDSPVYRNVQNLLRLARLGDAEAEDLVRAAELGEEELEATLTELSARPQFPFALLYGCQGGARLAAHVPNRALALAKEVAPWADRLPEAASGRPVSRPMVLAEAALLTSQAELRLLRAEEARAQAKRAWDLFSESNSDPVFDAGRCHYFEGSAATYLGKHDEALALLTGAGLAFAEASQDHWIGRAEATLGIVRTHLGHDTFAFEHFDAAARLLDPSLDALAWCANEMNRGTLLAKRGDLVGARKTFRLALASALRHGVGAVARDARINLAETQIEAGDYTKALEHLQVLAQLAREELNFGRMIYCQLLIAECLGGLGRGEEMTLAIGQAREARLLFGEMEPALEELFSSLREDRVDLRDVTRVRRFLREKENGATGGYTSIRVA